MSCVHTRFRNSFCCVKPLGFAQKQNITEARSPERTLAVKWTTHGVVRSHSRLRSAVNSSSSVKMRLGISTASQLMKQIMMRAASAIARGDCP